MLSVVESSSRQARNPAEARRIQKGARLKRFVDVLFSLLALLFLLPAFLLIAVALVFVDGWPVIYRHKRIGAKGRPFDCLKFRTMRRDADEKLVELLARDPRARKEWNETQKLIGDPRVHWLGRHLRSTSLDEIPQFINVLRGEMSLVGPRPVMASELERYGNQVHCYLNQRPGITGLWQVSRIKGTTYEERVQFDVAYYDTRSFSTDLLIMVKTIGVVFFARNEL